MRDGLQIRSMREADLSLVARAFADQGWERAERPRQRFWPEQQSGKRVVLIAEYNGEFAGCLTVLWQAEDSEFLSAGIPEIRNLSVPIKFRCMGVGGALMDEAERRIGERAKVAGLRVGLTADYGAAQVMYAKRGYVPDGRGISQREQLPRNGDLITIDNDLVLTLTKRLRE